VSSITIHRQTRKVGKYKEYFIEIEEDSLHKKHIIVRHMNGGGDILAIRESAITRGNVSPSMNVPLPLSAVLEPTYDTVTEAWRFAKKYVDDKLTGGKRRWE